MIFNVLTLGSLDYRSMLSGSVNYQGMYTPNIEKITLMPHNNIEDWENYQFTNESFSYFIENANTQLLRQFSNNSKSAVKSNFIRNLQSGINIGDLHRFKKKKTRELKIETKSNHICGFGALKESLVNFRISSTQNLPQCEISSDNFNLLKNISKSFCINLEVENSLCREDNDLISPQIIYRNVDEQELLTIKIGNKLAFEIYKNPKLNIESINTLGLFVNYKFLSCLSNVQIEEIEDFIEKMFVRCKKVIEDENLKKWLTQNFSRNSTLSNLLENLGNNVTTTERSNETPLTKKKRGKGILRYTNDNFLIDYPYKKGSSDSLNIDVILSTL